MELNQAEMRDIYDFLNQYGAEVVDVASLNGYSSSCLSGHWCFDGTCPFACPTLLRGEAAEALESVLRQQS